MCGKGSSGALKNLSMDDIDIRLTYVAVDMDRLLFWIKLNC